MPLEASLQDENLKQRPETVLKFVASSRVVETIPNISLEPTNHQPNIKVVNVSRKSADEHEEFR
jgi:hypothetical protein